MINNILEKYPSHKQVLYMKAKYDNNEPLSPSELRDLTRISEMVNQKFKM